MNATYNTLINMAIPSSKALGISHEPNTLTLGIYHAIHQRAYVLLYSHEVCQLFRFLTLCYPHPPSNYISVNMSSPMDLSHPLPTPYPKKSLYDPPIRILVDTRIHLLQGDTNEERNTFLINHICQLHWHTEFIPSKHRRYAFSTERFPIESTRCLFLVDCGQTASKEEDEDVPVVYYKWTGEFL